MRKLTSESDNEIWEKWCYLHRPKLISKYTNNYWVNGEVEYRFEYHNLGHILDCLDVLDSQFHRYIDTLEMRLAIWYHDCVYNPTSKINEEASREYAYYDLCPSLISPHRFQSIGELILATKHNERVSDEIGYLIQSICDIDLSILGAPLDRYVDYSRKIRDEYRIFETSIYNTGRIKVLESFLKREKIYHYLSHLEPLARQNIKSEIMYLSWKF